MNTETSTDPALSAQIANVLRESAELKEEAVALLLSKGVVLDLSTKWLTQKKYCEAFGINSVQTVNNWIKRGIIPPENVRVIPELNDLRLIKAVPYQPQ